MSTSILITLEKGIDVGWDGWLAVSFQLALRAGNEKEEGETADTVGCCSLRVEHIKLHPKLDGQEHVVEFDFLGKDSIRYYNKVSVEKLVSGAEMQVVSDMAILCWVSWVAQFTQCLSVPNLHLKPLARMPPVL